MLGNNAQPNPVAGIRPASDARRRRNLGELAAFGLGAAISAVLVLGVLIFLQPTYMRNDDFAMRTIASGIRTGEPSEYLIFISAIVGRVLKSLYMTWPSIHWYDLFLYTSLVVSGTCAFYAQLRQNTRGSWISSGLAGLLLISAAARPEFTIVSGLCAASGVILLLSIWKDQPGPVARICAGLLIVTCIWLGLLLRYNQALLVCAFALLLAAPFLILSWRHAPRKWAAITLASAALIGGITVALSHSMLSSAPGFRDFMEFNSARVLIMEYYDYVLGDSRLTPALEAIGWSPAAYNMLYHSFFTDQLLFTTEDFRRFADLASFAAAQQDSTVMLQRARQTIHDLWISYRLFAAAALFGILMLPGWRRGLAVFALGGLFTVATCILVSVFAKQIPYHVSFPIVFVWLMLAMLVSTSGERGPGPIGRIGPRLLKTSLALMFLSAASLLVKGIADTDRILRMEIGLQEQEMRLYAPDPTTVHLWWLGPPNAEFLLLPFRDHATEFNWIGLGWVTRSPLGMAQMQRWGVEQPDLELCQRPDILLLTEPQFLPIVSDFLSERYGMAARFEPVFEGHRLRVYRCVTG
jgi:hypothetical protein